MVLRSKNWNPRRIVCIAAALSFGSIAAAAHGATATITDGNSSLTFNQGISSTSPLVSNWVVDGTDQYGGSPAGSETLSFELNQNDPISINSLPITSSFAADGLYTATYSGDGFNIVVKDVLSGGSAGSGASAINEIIIFNNLSLDPSASIVLLDTFDYNVNATPNNDTLTLSPSVKPNTADQTDPLGAHINVSVTPTPVGAFVTSNGSTTILPGPFTGSESFEMDFASTVALGSSFQVSINQTLTGGEVAATSVPLPTASLSAGTMLAGLGAIAIKRRIRKPLVA